MLETSNFEWKLEIAARHVVRGARIALNGRGLARLGTLVGETQLICSPRVHTGVNIL